MPGWASPSPLIRQWGLSARLTFLGIEIDTLKGELRLLEEKLHRLQLLLSEWGDRKACTRKDLESLIGHLNHACKVVRSGRSVLRRMIDLLRTRSVSNRRQANAPIRLNSSFRADLAWWQTYARMEQDLLSPELSSATRAPDGLRRFGLLGLRGFHRYEVVPGPVDS